jgi:hypothetical protein
VPTNPFRTPRKYKTFMADETIIPGSEKLDQQYIWEGETVQPKAKKTAKARAQYLLRQEQERIRSPICHAWLS